MRIKTIFIALLFIGAFLACQKETNKVQNFAYAQKDEFIKKMQTELVKINSELKELEVKAKNIKKDSIAESNKKIQALQDKAAQLKMQIEKAKNATESSWDGVTADFNKGFGEFKDSIGEMRAWMSEKIAP
jgi:regulatory protein YycI of two-component signal transduction system YycFG